jgi:vitamin B12 transporter
MRRLFVAVAVLAIATPVFAQQDPVYPLDGFVVTGVPQPRPEALMGASVSILSGVELRERGITRVVDALRELSGVALVEGGSFGSVTSVFLRGGESDYVRVLVDGVPVNQPGGAFDFSGLTTDNVERIEVLRGPASALYGSDAIAGVIHVVTRGGSGAPSGSLSVLGGSYGRRDLTAGLRGSTGSVSYGFGLSEYASDGVLAFNNGFRNRVFSGVIRFIPDERSRVAVSARLGQREYHFPTDGSGVVVDRNAFTYADDFTLGLDLERRLSERLAVGLAVSSYESDDGTDDAADGPADTLGFYGYTSLSSMRRTRVRAQSHVELFDGTVGTLGVEASQQSLRAFNESLSEFGPSSGRSDDQRWNRAMFGHVVTGVGRLGANAGVRLEDNERFGGSVTWQLGASWALTGSTRLRAAAGTGIKEPTLSENFATGFAVGNPDLEPERSVSWELGLEQELFGGAVGMQAGWFDQRFEDLIQYAFTPPEAGGPNFFNVAAARARGVEAEVVVGLGPVRVSGDATWLDTEVVDAGFDSGAGATFVAGQRLLRRPGLSFGGSVGYAHDARGRISLGLRHVGDRDDRDFSTFPATPVTLDAYTLLSVGGELTVLSGAGRAPGVTLTVRGENLLDRRHEEAFGFVRPGRAVYAGLRVGLGGR